MNRLLLGLGFYPLLWLLGRFGFEKRGEGFFEVKRYLDRFFIGNFLLCFLCHRLIVSQDVV